jgi:hypothetical protein
MSPLEKTPIIPVYNNFRFYDRAALGKRQFNCKGESRGNRVANPALQPVDRGMAIAKPLLKQSEKVPLIMQITG